MSVVISYAALAPEAERRVRLASAALAAFRIDAVARPWGGDACNLLVVDADGADGQVAADQARRRGTPIIGFTRDEASGGEAWAGRVGHDDGVAALARAMRDALAATGGVVTGEGGPASEGGYTGRPLSEAGLVRLAMDARLQGGDVMATAGGRRLVLCRSTGRVHAGTHSDMLHARGHLGDTDWKFVPVEAGARRRGLETVSSLDSLLLAAAMSAREVLPGFPEGSYWLGDWPDLGAVPEYVSPLRVARQLQRGRHSVLALLEATGLPALDVNACLWAFAASGVLLQGGAPAPAERAPLRKLSHLLSRLARHVGLGGR